MADKKTQKKKAEDKAREQVVRKQPDSSFEERTQVQQPWRDDNGDQVTGAEGENRRGEPQIVTPEED